MIHETLSVAQVALPEHQMYDGQPFPLALECRTPVSDFAASHGLAGHTAGRVAGPGCGLWGDSVSWLSTRYGHRF